jgi:hypothetical protein
MTPGEVAICTDGLHRIRFVLVRDLAAGCSDELIAQSRSPPSLPMALRVNRRCLLIHLSASAWIRLARPIRRDHPCVPMSVFASRPRFRPTPRLSSRWSS